MEKKQRFLTNILFFAVIIGLAFLIMKFMLSYLLPFVIGILLAFIMQRPAKAISKHIKIKSGICAAILVIAAFILAVSSVIMLFWGLVSLAEQAARLMPQLLNRAYNVLIALRDIILESFPDLAEDTLNGVIANIFDSLSSRITLFFSSAATKTVKYIPAFLVSCVATIVASFYFAKDFEGFLRFFNSLIKPETGRRIYIIKDIITGSILKLAAGYITLMLLTLLELTLGLYLLKIKYFYIIAFLIAFVDLLPVLGCGTVLVPWSVTALALGNRRLFIGLLALYAVITVIRNFAEPKIIGKKIGINPLLTLITMFLGLKIAGILGMIILPISVITVIKYYKMQLEEEKRIIGG